MALFGSCTLILMWMLMQQDFIPLKSFRFGHKEEERVLVRDLHNASIDTARFLSMLHSSA